MISEKRNILEKITNCNGQLYEVILESEDLNLLVLNFFVTEALSIKIRVDNPMLFSLARFPDEDGTYLITEASIVEVKNTDYSLLEKLNYKLRKDGKPYLDKDKALWLHIEGDVIIDILCENFDITEIEGKPRLGI